MMLLKVSALLLVCSAFRHDGDLQKEHERDERFASSSEGEQILKNLGEKDLMWFPSMTHGYDRENAETAAKVIKKCWQGGRKAQKHAKTGECISNSFGDEWEEAKYNVLLASKNATDFVMTAAYDDQIVFEWHGYKITIWSTMSCEQP